MKRAFEKINWTYREGKFYAEGGRENKYFGTIYFKIAVDPICGDGSVKFTSLIFTALNKTVLITAGMEDIEQVIENYYEWARSLWNGLPQEELARAEATRVAIINRALEKMIMEQE